MKLLLDTHIFLWWNFGDPQLPQSMRAELASSKHQIWVSAASVWEIAIKRASNKLSFTGSISSSIATHHFLELPIFIRHTEWAGGLPLLHSDPFDRLLVAQAHLEGMVLATVDAQILKYQVPHL
jgi:PIN domain nuclease of toxin-antitoxin system